MTSTMSPPRGRTGPARPRPHGRRRSRALKRRLRLIVLLTVLALIVGGWVVGFSSLLDTRNVRISGARILTADLVRETAAVPLGRPLARQDLDAVTTRVAGLAPVESVRVDRRWPHTVTIAVTERTPLLAVPAVGGFTLVDRSGLAFQTVPVAPEGVIEARVDLQNSALLAEVGAVATGMGELAADAVRIEATSPSAVVVVLTGKIAVMWGSAEQSELKGQIVTQLLKQDPKAIDVSAPHSPAIR